MTDEIVEEWVDSNVTSPQTDENDAVTDCCCDKRVLIDNGNWAVKMPRRNMTVKESIEFCNVLKNFIQYMHHLGYTFDDWLELGKLIKEYKGSALTLLEEQNCITYKGDIE